MTPIEGEILGTFLLVLMGAGVCANTALNGTYGKGAGWVVVTFGWGLGVFAGVSVAGPYSGAHINPAVTLGLAVAGKFGWAAVPGYVLGQMLGAMLGALVVWLCYYDHYRATADAGTKRGTFCTGPAIANVPVNFFNEFVGTFVLVLVVLYFSAPAIESEQLGELAVGLGAIGGLPVALLVVAIGMSLGGTTGYAINPARDLGPRLVYSLLPIPDKGSSEWGYAWVPVFGPLLGATVAAALYLGLG